MEGAQDGIFEIPDSVYESEGWGPPKTCNEPYFIPFAPFSRSDRLGKIADWISPHGEGGGSGEFYKRGDDRRKRSTFPAQQYFGSEADSTFSFANNQGDYHSFSLVDRTTTQKKSNFRQGRHMRGGLFGGRGGHSNIIGRHGFSGYFNYHQQRKDDRRQGGHKKGNPWFDKSNRAKDFFIEVNPGWVYVREFEFDAISKMYFAQAKFTEDIEFRGVLNMYNDMYEGAAPRKNELMLKPVRGPIDRLGVMDDPQLEKLIDSSTTEFTVFTTERILSVLMCCTSSVYPWDIKIIKKGNTLIMDKSSTQSVFNIHVCENSADIPLQDGGDDRTANSPAFLLAETMSVNDNIKLQVQNPKSGVHFKRDLENQESTAQPKAAPGFAYRYMKWSLGEEVCIIIRATIDMMLQKGQANRTMERLPSFPKELSEAALINIRALTECDPKIIVSGQAQVTTEEWRKSLETHCGTVLATEIRCGKNKISRWAVSSILAGVDQIKLAYVSRINPRSRDSHSILLVNSLNPETIAQNCSINMASCWGIVKAFIDYMRNTPDTIDGEYRLMRDMNKPLLRIYRCFKTEEELDAEI